MAIVRMLNESSSLESMLQICHGVKFTIKSQCDCIWKQESNISGVYVAQAKVK